MIKLGTLLLLFLHVLVPSFQVIISPCRVENFLTQPHYGTNLARKELVQIVQIPPVFSQNVMVGKCINASSETSGAPGNHFVCKQRYTTIELYIMEHQEVYIQTSIYNGSSPIPIPSESPSEKFKSTNFIRDYVVVESGCDFSFNLLPLLLQQYNTNSYPQQQPQYVEGQNNHFLNSPFYPQHPDYLPKPGTNYPRNIGNSNLQSPAPVPATPVNSQGGNGNPYSGDRGADLPAIPNNQYPSTNYAPVNYPSGLKGRASGSDDAAHSASGYVYSHKHNSPKTNQGPELYSSSDKIGVPLHILSPKVDPLLTNVDHQAPYYPSN